MFTLDGSLYCVSNVSIIGFRLIPPILETAIGAKSHRAWYFHTPMLG